MDGKFIYADTVMLQVLMRTYEYSVWDQESNSFTEVRPEDCAVRGVPRQYWYEQVRTTDP